MMRFSEHFLEAHGSVGKDVWLALVFRVILVIYVRDDNGVGQPFGELPAFDGHLIIVNHSDDLVSPVFFGITILV